jgi:transcription-repair coupling factor (superfamily II helicase)
MTDVTDSQVYQNPLAPPPIRQAKLRQTWSNLHGSSIALVLSQMAQHHVCIVITPDSLTAQRVQEEIKFYTRATADDAPSIPLFTFPDWETLPYDIFSPHQDIISERLTTLYHLPDLTHGILILPVTTLMYRLPPVNYVKGNSLLLSRGQSLDIHKLREQLASYSYQAVTKVEERGQYAIRGSLLDLFPMGSEFPYRIDLFDNEIETIRVFSAETQLSQYQVEAIHLLPAREFPLTVEAIELFRTQWFQYVTGESKRSPIFRDVCQGFAPAGIEYYLPLFFPQTQTLFDYLPNASIICTFPTVLSQAEQFWHEAQQRYELLRHDIERPILAPQHLFLQANQLFEAIAAYSHLRFNLTEASHSQLFATQIPPALPVEARLSNPVAALQHFVQQFSGRVLITAETLGRRETLLELLKNQHLYPEPIDTWQHFIDSDITFAITIATIEQGLLLDRIPQPIAVITETQLFGERVAQRRLRRKTTPRDTDAIVRNLTELTLGAPVVHEEHGVGRYQGLVTLEIDNGIAEFLLLEYAGEDKLYVPVTSLDLISRFTSSDPEHAPLHRLGSNQWDKAKRKALQQVSDIAVELLDIHARRAARPGRACKIVIEDYQAFAATFPFEETPDQQEAIDAVLADLTAPRAMDRLICGDVGFGKTEVAMRAAFVAVQDGLQVAVLVPTTLLAQQHFQNFQDRFTSWAVRVEQLSRFRTAKQQKDALQEIAAGKVEIIIGTHKLLQDGIEFKNLGLVIIDEEHRFGVKQKEKFKQLRAEVDILTLTATPIPRSLNMALSNLRDLSIIATPPARRLTIKTFVNEWQDGLIAEAITRELKRGGQVYFLHNDIDTIEVMAKRLQNLIPEAQVHYAHGKMRESELEKVMQNFYHRRFNVLVCTTIIETGIDIPTANTIIIHRADKFGLAQLYQLRGRVGRSHHRAYAYLIVPPRKAMTTDAIKRLEVIHSLEELGVGFTLATHDLEIRGAGELLGSEQSGHIEEVGYGLYLELLERAVNAIKSGKQPDLEKSLVQGTEVDLHTPAVIPNTYVDDVHTRLVLYKQIAHAKTLDKLEEIRIEMIDRFGLLPESAKTLFKITELKLQAMRLGVRKIDFGSQGGYVLFNDSPSIDTAKLVQLLQVEPKTYRFDGQRLRLLLAVSEFTERWKVLNYLLNYLQLAVSH